MATTFSIERDQLLAAMQLVAGVLEKRQTLPILSHVLLQLEGDQLSLVATDLELELVARAPLSAPVDKKVEITVPGRKLLDLCRALPDQTGLTLRCQANRVGVEADLAHSASKFDLSTLPAKDFPRMAVDDAEGLQLRVPQKTLKALLNRTQFAMAQQDVRHYLNGLLLEVMPSALRTVATDGHRLALSTESFEHDLAPKQVIVPRKGVAELSRFLEDTDELIDLQINDRNLTVHAPAFSFVSKLIDHRFPDYQRALPKAGDKIVEVDRTLLKASLSRVAILSNEKFRGISIQFAKNKGVILANNPEQENAEETIDLSYDGPDIEIGFNVNYLLDVLSTLTCATVRFVLTDASGSVEIRGVEAADDSMYVVMPLRL